MMNQLPGNADTSFAGRHQAFQELIMTESKDIVGELLTVHTDNGDGGDAQINIRTGVLTVRRGQLNDVLSHVSALRVYYWRQTARNSLTYDLVGVAD